MKLTGGEIVAEYLIRQGVPYVIGIPGHGCLGLADAFIGREKKIKVLQAKQEMSAVHMADGYYRVTGKPLVVFTSIGPGAINTAIGAATAFVDSTSVLIITGGAHTHMRGRGLLQEIERSQDADFPAVLEPIVKRSWRVDTVEQLPGILSRAFNQMLTGRRGPVHIDLPMDVQCASTDVDFQGPEARRPTGRIKGDSTEIKRAAALLARAKKPVILAGGGIHSARAYRDLQKLAEMVGAAVVTTMQGKSVFPEDHPLYAWHTGSKGTTVGLKMTSTADVLLAVGCRFADETSSSYKHGVSFAIPPTKLIHIDLDPTEIGKNYPVEVGIVGDAKSVLADVAKALKSKAKKDYTRTAHFKELQKEKQKWARHIRKLQNKKFDEPTITQALQEIRENTARDAFIVHSSGNAQAQILQEFPFYEPMTCVTTGGFSTMGFTVPAALGVKLAHPRRQVVGITGDGEFMMTMQELSSAVEQGINTVTVVLNNAGWIAIKDLQQAAYGEDRAIATDFLDKKGKPHYIDFSIIADAFGCYSELVDAQNDIGPALKRCLKAGRPALLEIRVHREYPYSGSPAAGWWDVPIPTYLKDRRAKYEKDIKKERLK